MLLTKRKRKGRLLPTKARRRYRMGPLQIGSLISTAGSIDAIAQLYCGCLTSILLWSVSLLGEHFQWLSSDTALRELAVKKEVLHTDESSRRAKLFFPQLFVQSWFLFAVMNRARAFAKTTEADWAIAMIDTKRQHIDIEPLPCRQKRSVWEHIPTLFLSVPTIDTPEQFESESIRYIRCVLAECQIQILGSFSCLFELLL